jgi:hypothetical protein
MPVDVAFMEEMRNERKVLVGKPEWKISQGVGRNLILKLIVHK